MQIAMNLQFFGGRGAKSDKSGATLSKIQPESSYMQDVQSDFEWILNIIAKHGGINYNIVNITENDLQIMEEKMRKMTNSSDIHVGIRFDPKNLEEIINSGRFKSQFETGTSGGILDTQRRSDLEKRSMGYSLNLSPKDRPIYGMLFEGKNTSNIKISEAGGKHYGEAVAILKPSVKTHSTVTFYDSLDLDGSIQPSPLLKPSRYSIPTREGHGFRTADFIEEFYHASKSKQPMKLNKLNKRTKTPYVEVQIHGGKAKVSNIEQIIFPRGTPKSLIPIEILRKNNIKWSIERK